MITSEPTAKTNQKFTSYDRSDKTGLDYAVNRIYSSEQGRFTQPDPIGMASVDLTDPQTLNMYTYARNNPVDFTDPSGTLPNVVYFLDGIEVPARMALRALASGSAELPRGYSGPLGYWVDFDDWSKTDEYGFPGTGTTFVSNTLYIQGLLDRTGPSSPVRNTREGFGGYGGYSGEDYNLSNSVRESAGAQPKPRGDWRVRALVRGGAPTAEAARPTLNVIATVMSFFTLPATAAGSGVRLSLGSKGVIQLTRARFGHTFTRHGEDATTFLINRAKGSGMPQGQFLDNQKAARFILDNLGKTTNGAVNIPIPRGFPARLIMPDGTFKAATHIRLVPVG